MRLFFAAVVGIVVSGLVWLPAQRVRACGCLAPPAVSDGQYAVNQSSELIIFEVEPGTVTAHVLIRYAGDPAEFAWIIPVPSLPELSLSETFAFPFLEQATRPVAFTSIVGHCPAPEWTCVYPPPRVCPGDPCGPGPGVICLPDSGVPVDAAHHVADSAPRRDAGGSAMPPPVDILRRETIGAYDTIVFAAGDAMAAVDWLRDNGFIVNRTMSPYMQPYADEGKLFVAARLIPGADLDELRPLRMRYAADRPEIPLRLTAVATEPNLTVTAFIYGAMTYEPIGHELVEIDPEDVAFDPAGRLNYPMLLARAADAAGGDGFVLEYSGPPPPPLFDASPCCATTDFDMCRLAGDGACSCPGNTFDTADCEATAPAALAGADLVRDLASRYAYLTRLSTRLSAEEMTFDPEFGPTTIAPEMIGSLQLSGTTPWLDGCYGDIIDQDAFADIQARQPCATVYCDAGECVTTGTEAAGCLCQDGYVGRTFTDLDGLPSVTCVPVNSPVDFREGGLELIDACAGYDCGEGSCIDVGGFPTCRCEKGAAARAGTEGRVVCELGIVQHTGGPGGANVLDALADLDVCAPRPPDCGPTGWLVPTSVPASRRGEACESSRPTPEQLEVKEAPPCPEVPGAAMSARGGGCEGCAAGGGAPLGIVPALLLGVWLVVRRRR